MLTKEERRIWLAKHGGNQPFNKERTIDEVRHLLVVMDNAQAKVAVLRQQIRRASCASIAKGVSAQ